MTSSTCITWPGLPYSPTPLSFWQLIAMAMNNPLLLFEKKHFEELTVVTSTPIGRRIVTSDPAIIEHVLLNNTGNYRRDNIQRRMVRRMIDHSIFAAESDRWQNQRKLMAPFFTARAVQAYEPAIFQTVQALLDKLASSELQSVDIAKWMSELAVSVIVDILFPRFASIEDSQDIAASICRFGMLNGNVKIGDLAGLPDWFPAIPTLGVIKEQKRITRRSKRILAAHKDDIGSIANQLQTGCTNQEAIGNISALLGAGTDTTVAALTWAIMMLSTDSNALEQVRKEAAILWNDKGDTNKLQQATWTQAVIDESMRLFSPTPMLGRQALNEDRLGDLTIKKGDVVVIAPWVVHRHRLLWQEPDEFKPERFLPQVRKSYNRYQFIPFGAGPRICIGASLARKEMILAVSRFAHLFEFAALQSLPIELLQQITLKPKNGLQMKLQLRSDNPENLTPAAQETTP